MGRHTKDQNWRDAISRSVTKLTPEVVNKLKNAFSIGATIEQACVYAEISKQTYYNWTEKNPVLLDEFDKMRKKLPLAAKNNIATSIKGLADGRGDIGLSKWLMERTESDAYGDRVKIEHTGDMGGAHPEDLEAVEAFHMKLKENLRKRSQERAKREGEL